MNLIELLSGLLTVVLFIDAVMLVLVILVQLPKKEAGPGVAFGGGAADALFGAGAGDHLTKFTKIAATVFLSLAIVLTILNNISKRAEEGGVDKALERNAAEETVPPADDSEEPAEALEIKDADPDANDAAADPSAEAEDGANGEAAPAPTPETPTEPDDQPAGQ